METHCQTCDSIQPCDIAEEGGSAYLCETCGDQVHYSPANTKYSGYKIGRVLSVELIPKQKDLKKVMVDVTGDRSIESALSIVTNAKYVEETWLVVVATQGAIVPAGSVLDDDPEAIEVRKRAVGGISSQGILLCALYVPGSDLSSTTHGPLGMLCDSPMLGWTGGAKGAIQRLPEDSVVGSAPPDSRPR